MNKPKTLSPVEITKLMAEAFTRVGARHLSENNPQSAHVALTIAEGLNVSSDLMLKAITEKWTKP